MTLCWRILQSGRRKKDHGSPTLCTFKDLSCSYGNLDLAASNSRNTRKFSSYSSAQFCLFQTFCIISSLLFPFKLLLVSLLTLPPQHTTTQYRLAYDEVYTTCQFESSNLMYHSNGLWEEREGEERNFKVFCCFQCLE